MVQGFGAITWRQVTIEGKIEPLYVYSVVGVELVGLIFLDMPIHNVFIQMFSVPMVKTAIVDLQVDLHVDDDAFRL